MSNIVKNQHYLPKFYLKGFCDQESKITIFDRERGEIRFNQNPQKYAVERYFYDTDSKELKKLFEKWVILYPKLCNIINIDDKQFIEHFFNRLETDIAKLFETILNDPDVLYDQKNQSLIAYFLYTLAYRTAPYRNSMDDSYNQFMSQMKERNLDENMIKKISEDIGMSSGAKSYQLEKLFDIDSINDFDYFIKNNYSWYYAIVEDTYGLLTSDNPALNGILHFNDFCFPLTPNFALIFRSKDPNAKFISQDIPHGNKLILSFESVLQYNRANLFINYPYKYIFGQKRDIIKYLSFNSIEKELLKILNVNKH
ncbi:DUF4238 domain-containing protein [bacterium]|nr:DUF4238 domain-containing protein [bacterium]